MCPCFGLDPAPRVFSKLLKIPVCLLRKINIRVIIYLDDMLILSYTIREAHMSQDTVIYLLQNLGFITNIKKSMTLSLTPVKVQKIVKTCQNLLRNHSATLLELTRVVGLLSSTIQAVEPAKIQLRFLQQQQIVCLRKKNELSVSNNIKHQVKNRVNLVNRELEVLQWPKFFSVEPTSNYSNRCFPDRVGSSLQWGSNIKGIVKGRENLINVRKPYKCAGTTSDKTGSIFLHQREKGESHTLSDRQQGSLYLFKLGGTKNEHMIRLSKEMWHYLLNRNMAITAEYLPSVLNTVADRESRKKPDPSEWLLHPKVFQAVSRLLGSPTIDLFAFCLCHQLPQYIA